MSRILIADRQEFFRIGLTVTLERHSGWQVIAEAENGQAALDLAQSLRPDVAIIDLTLTDPGGLKVIQYLRTVSPGIRIIASGVYITPTVMRQVHHAGARAFLTPRETALYFTAAVESVLLDRPFFLSQTLALPETRETDLVSLQYLLSDRQLEVLRLLANGRSGKEVGGALSLSTRTVESHISRIMTRLQMRSRVELIKLAVRDGIV